MSAPGPEFGRRRFLAAGASTLGAGALAILAGRDPGPTPLAADVVVIGSGFAGTFLAQALVDRGHRVLVLEAGPALVPGDPPEGRAKELPWHHAGELAFPVDDTRTIGLGGTSRRWNGVATRLMPTDFETRSRFGLFVDWPLGYPELDPWYCRAEAALGVVGGAPVEGAEPPRTCAYPRLGPAYRPPRGRHTGEGLAWFGMPFGVRGPEGPQGPVRLVDRELPRLAASGLAGIRTSCTALRLLPGPAGRIDAVEVRGEGGRVERIGARAFVVAAGPFESARLLLASAHPRAPRGLGNGGGHLGAHLNAHPRFRLELPPDPGAGPDPFIHRTLTPADTLRRRGLGAIMVDLHPRREHTILDTMLELEPAASNRVAPRARAVPGQLLAGEVAMAWTALDRATRAESGTLLDTLAGPLRAHAHAPELAWFHPAGTCRMARHEADGVVDPRCLVFGTRNLYVAGASTFPTSGCGNPTLTVVALALRLADELARRLGSDLRA